MTGPQYSVSGFPCIPAKWYACTNSPILVPQGRFTAERSMPVPYFASHKDLSITFAVGQRLLHLVQRQITRVLLAFRNQPSVQQFVSGDSPQKSPGPNRSGRKYYLMMVASPPATAVKASTICSEVTPYSGFSMTKKARSPQTTACFSVASTQTHLRVSMLSNMV